jgi:hypothetical protein
MPTGTLALRNHKKLGQQIPFHPKKDARGVKQFFGRIWVCFWLDFWMNVGVNAGNSG